MCKYLLFQIVKQILVNLVVHLFNERRFLVNGTSSHPPPPPPWYTTSFWYVIHYHVLHLPCKGSCVSQGEQLRIRKSFKLYIVLYRNTMKNMKISLNKIWYTYMYTALIPTNMMFLYSINANFDWNVLVEQMIKIRGKDARFIVKFPCCSEMKCIAKKYKVQCSAVNFIIIYPLFISFPVRHTNYFRFHWRNCIGDLMANTMVWKILDSLCERLGSINM